MTDLPAVAVETILDALPIVVLVVDRSGTIVRANRRSEAVLGYRPDELVGQPIEVLVPDRFRGLHSMYRDSYAADPKMRPMGSGLQLVAKRRDGSEFPVDISLAPVETGGETLIAAVVRDITEQQRMANRIQGLLDAAPDATVVVDATGTIVLVNRQVEALFGYEPEELVGRPVEVLVPDRSRATHDAFRDGYVNEPTSRPMGAGAELSARRKDGTEFPADISLSAVDTDQGILVSASVRDVTERRIAAEHAAVVARDRRTERLETVGKLAGGVAHDFNNLLAVILNNIDFALDELPEDSAARVEIEGIGEAAQRAAALTRQLLLFSRRGVMNPEVLQVNDVLVELEKLLRRTVPEYVELKLSLQEQLEPVRVDRSQLEQVVMNLVINARDAMPHGGLIALSTAITTLEAGDWQIDAQPGDYVCITVSDSGTGMTEEVQARALEPFFTTKGPGEGSGLGLATVYGIVTQAGGDLTLYSEPDRGTTARVFLPVTTEQPAEVRVSEAAVAPGQGEVIVLVEDENGVREAARRILERAGYSPLAFSSPLEALAAFERGLPDVALLLTDVVMPDMSGRELAERVVVKYPDLPIVYMSGYPQEVIVHRGALEPGVNLLDKPFTRVTMLNKVVDVLKDGAARGERTQA